MINIVGFTAVLGVGIKWRLLRIWETVRLIGLIIFSIVIVGLVIGFILSLGWVGLFIVSVIVGLMVLAVWLEKVSDNLEEEMRRSSKNFEKTTKFRTSGRVFEIELEPIKDWKENWTIWFIVLLGTICFWAFFVGLISSPPSTAYRDIEPFLPLLPLLFPIFAISAIMLLPWAIAKHYNSLYIKAIKELCEIKYYHGRDSQQFKTCIDKHIKICRIPERCIGRGGGYSGRYEPPEPIRDVEERLRDLVEISYESWCEEFAGQHTQNSRADEKGTDKIFEEE